MKRLLKRLSLFLTILLITTNVFASEEELIQELKNRLEKSNETIEQLINKVEEKSAVNDQLRKQVEKKEEKIKEYEEEIKGLTERLKVSNNTIDKLVKRVEEDQKEIERLRKSLDDTSDYVEESNTFFIGGNPTYPLGGQVVFGTKFNALPFGIYSTFAVQEDYYISGGIGVMFEF